MLQCLSSKFPQRTINYYHIVESLVYFDDAEQEPMPRMLRPLEWQTAKNYFLSLQKELLNSI